MAERYGRRMRRQILRLYEQGWSTAEVAAATGGSESGVRRVRQHFRERGTPEPLPHAGGHAGRTPQLEAALRQVHEQHPDAYLHEVHTEFLALTGVNKGLSTIGLWLRQMGLSRKKRRPTPASSSVPTSPRPAPPG